MIIHTLIVSYSGTSDNVTKYILFDVGFHVHKGVKV